MNRTRWLILILGPLPLAGSSWAVSAWFRSAPADLIAPNTVVAAPFGERVLVDETNTAARQGRGSDDALSRECAGVAARLEGQLGSECHVVSRPPFVVAGDLELTALDTWHDETIAPAVRAMQARYFKTLPNRAVSVLLFRSEASYNHYCRKLFAESEISVYGYYKPHLRTLVLNVSTGSGTLLHELTHALMAFDFPGVPDWFNEGLASLHEQCRFRTDEAGPWIEGLVNWRLEGLQEVIRQGRLRSLRALVEASDFRGRLVGTNYAQARYLCLYMQERGVLEAFFRAFRASHATDPSGVRSLAATFPDMSWDELDRDFQLWAAGLSQPR